MFVCYFPSSGGKLCWLSECKLDILMSSLAKAEPSVSMVTRSSLFYGYPLTSLWSYFSLNPQPYRHTHIHTHIFFFSTLLVFVAFFTSSFLLSHSALSSIIASHPGKFSVLSKYGCFQCLAFICPLPLFSHSQYVQDILETMHRLNYTPTDAALLLIFQQVDSGCMFEKLFSSFWWPCTSVVLGSSVF